MNWETLEARWSLLENRLEQTRKVQLEGLRQKVVEGAWRKVRWHGLGQIWELVSTVGFLVVCGLLWWRCSFPWALEWALGGLVIAAIVLFVDQARLLGLFLRIPWSGPIVPIQAALARWRLERARQVQWILLWSPLAGFFLLLIGFSWLTGKDPFQIGNPWWIGLNLAFGLAFPVVGALLANWLSSHFRGSAWWDAVLDGLSGAGITQAQKELAQWNPDPWNFPE